MPIKWNPCIIIEGETLWEEIPFMLPEEKLVVLLEWNCPCYFLIHFLLKTKLLQWVELLNKVLNWGIFKKISLHGAHLSILCKLLEAYLWKFEGFLLASHFLPIKPNTLKNESNNKLKLTLFNIYIYYLYY